MSILKEIYSLREGFIVIALTGRTGVGCSRVADILTAESKEFFKLVPNKFPKKNLANNEQRKYNIAYDYVKSHWRPFELVEYKRVIALMLLKYSISSFKSELHSFENTQNNVDLFTKNDLPKIDQYLNGIQPEFDKLHRLYKHYFNERSISELKSPDDLKKLYSIWQSDEFRSLSDNMHDGLSQISFTFRIKFIQRLVNNIRQFGAPFSQHKKQAHDTYIYLVAETINKIIKSIRDNNKENKGQIRVVIDSLRNSLEIRFFKERYSAFYTMAVNAMDASIKSNLLTHYKSESIVEEILKIDKDEYKGKDGKFYVQDVANCIQKSDVHLNNSLADNKTDSRISPKLIYSSLLKYVALILHPGIISPTPEERCMQFAYTAKYNSGCISRQVGALVTDQFYSIKGVGWNNTPENQVPCQLRNIEDLIKGSDKKAFSEYEKEDADFRRQLVKEKIPTQTQLDGRNCSFCFKDIQNKLEDEKNQVHTRSLHAEENAMLQIVKYGGGSLMGGILFSTASPCELCSKKAYQLGISKIYYIDPYPGIARRQTLKGGTKDPELILFTGAIGNAYHKFYEPFMNYKEELRIL